MTYDVVVDDREFRRVPPPQRKKLRELWRRLREEPFVGDRIRRDLVPAPFRHLPNLYRLELPDGWQALYAVTTNEVSGDTVRVVWIGDHKRYERLFGF